MQPAKSADPVDELRFLKSDWFQFLLEQHAELIGHLRPHAFANGTIANVDTFDALLQGIDQLLARLLGVNRLAPVLGVGRVAPPRRTSPVPP